MVLPQGGILQDDTQTEEMPSRTYRLYLNKKRIVGMTDQLDAIKQACFKILQTERFEHLIYSSSYGYEGNGLIGRSPLFVQSEIKRRVREALLQDDRVTQIEEFQLTVNGDSALVQFTVVTDYGSFDMEVSKDV